MTKSSNAWIGREVDWNRDGKMLRELFNTTWVNHPITKKDYFEWNLVDYYQGCPIAYCAEPTDRDDLLAGVYILMPTTIWVEGRPKKFSTSIYTFTHPLYYKKGIFTRLARMAYDKCKQLDIAGTVGVPNTKSLPGFSGKLRFDVIGQFEMMAKFASFFRPAKSDLELHYITSEKDLRKIELNIHKRKSQSGIVLCERNFEFCCWRFLHCPSVPYHIYTVSDVDDCVTGMMVLRTAKKRKVPITVIVDLLIDEAHEKKLLTINALLGAINRFAWRRMTPLITTLVNPFSYEAQVLRKNGYIRIPKIILPHASNFILKFHLEQTSRMFNALSRFKNWHFSFADYDIF